MDSERGIAWRSADSLSLRTFLGYALDEETPDHSTISRTRRLYWLETHKAVFRWVVKFLVKDGLISGQTVSIDGTTLEANAAMKSIVRRDNGQSYEEYLKGLAQAAGMENPTREQLARLDRKREKKGSNQEWKSPSDPDARITKMKDGRTHLAPGRAWGKAGQRQRSDPAAPPGQRSARRTFRRRRLNRVQDRQRHVATAQTERHRVDDAGPFR